MVESGSPILFFIFVYTCLFSFSPVVARTVVQVPKTSVFDVSASIQRTIDILSFNPDTLQQTQAQESKEKDKSSPFTLKLYSRDTLQKTPFKNYRDLAMSRLKRDAARVNFLYKKLNSSLKGDVTSGFLPMDLETPVTSGESQGSGEYFARVGFGTPAAQLYTSIDTGSDLAWIQCQPCQCYKQTDPIFDPSKSSSYQNLNMNYKITYGDSSFTEGELAKETLVLGDSPAITNITIGCGRNNQGDGLFVGAAGIFGLGRGRNSFPSQTQNSAFSYCLVDRDSTAPSTLEFGSSSIPSDAVTTPLLPNSRHPSFYYVGLTGISVNGEMLPIPASMFAIDASGNGGVIVDSGTAVTRFTPGLYNQIRDGFVKGTNGLTPVNGVPFFDTCYDLTSKSVMDVPAVVFHFDSVSLSLPAKNVMIPVGNNIFCFGFAPTNANGQTSIIGNFQQQGIRISYDEDKSQVGFSANKC